MNPLTQPVLADKPVEAHQKWRLDPCSTDGVARLMRSMFRHFDGSFTLHLWDGTCLNLGRRADEALPTRFSLVLHHAQIASRMLLGSHPLRLAEAYFRGDIDINGDFFAALRLKDHLQAIHLSPGERLKALITALRLRYLPGQSQSPAQPDAPQHGLNVRTHSRTENQRAIQFHYDVSNAFYALWLDTAMVYSCAYFEHADDSLEVAQQAKLEHICRKLMLRPSERLLDIGCGWGALLIHAAQRHGVYAHGVTLSRQQYDMARERIEHAGLQGRVSVELLDYRDLKGESSYDKIASVGMFEHVGLKNLPVYFSCVNRLLKPGGLFLNHGITHDVEGWQKTMFTEFINRYVFPDGQLDTVSNIQRGMEHAGFEINDVESLRPHYALTLRHWVGRIENNHAQALRYINESTFRVWRLYMTGCALDFESGETGVYQILACKRTTAPLRQPLTRRHLYGNALSQTADSTRPATSPVPENS